MQEKEFEEKLRKKIDGKCLEMASNVSRKEKIKYLKYYCEEHKKCRSCGISQKLGKECIESNDCESCTRSNVCDCSFGLFTDEELDEFYAFVKTIKKENFEKSYEEKQKIHKNYIKAHTKEEILAVVIEEMSELTKHLTKIMRGKEPMKDNYGCIEEMADVQICLDTLKEYISIPDSVMTAAIEVKLQRYKKERNDTNEK